MDRRFFSALKEVNPLEYTQTELCIMAIVSVVGTAFAYLIGGIDNLMAALLIFIAIDYFTGVIAAWITHSVDSNKGFEGAIRKIVILSVVVMAHWLDIAVNTPDTFKTMIIFAYIGNEGISICENLDRMGCGKCIPDFLRAKLIQLREEKNQGGKTK